MGHSPSWPCVLCEHSTAQLLRCSTYGSTGRVMITRLACRAVSNGCLRSGGAPCSRRSRSTSGVLCAACMSGSGRWQRTMLAPRASAGAACDAGGAEDAGGAVGAADAARTGVGVALVCLAHLCSC